MNLSVALTGLLAAGAINISAGAGTMGSHNNYGHRALESTSLTASTVARAQRSVQLAVKAASSVANRKRRRQLIATRVVLLAARRAHHDRQRGLQGDMDLSAFEEMLASIGITVPEDEDGNPDLGALAAQFGIDLDDMPTGDESDGDMGDMMGDMDLGDFDLDSILGGDFSLEDLMGGDDGMGGDDMDKDLEDMMGDMDFDMDGLEDLFGGLFGDGEDGDPASGIGSFICGFMGMVEEVAGQTCECDASSGDLVLTCSMTEEICDTPTEGGVMQMDGVAEGVEFCVSNVDSKIVIPLDLFGNMFDEDGNLIEGGGTADEDIPEATVDTCATYSAPAFVAGKEFCFKITMDLDMGEMMGDGTSDADAMENLSEIVQCEASIDGKNCQSCSICDNGLGIELNCPGLFSVSCTDVMGAGGDGDEASPTDGLPTGTTIIRFAQATGDSSPATNSNGSKFGAMAAITVLSLSSFVAFV